MGSSSAASHPASGGGPRRAGARHLVDLAHQRESGATEAGPRRRSTHRAARRRSASAGSAITASPSQLGATPPARVHEWFNSINEDRAPSDQSHGGRSGRQRAADRGERARSRERAGADLAVTPELALAGYLPRDLLLSAGFRQPLLEDRSLRWPGRSPSGPPVLVGLPEPNPSDEGRPLFNTAVLLRDGRVDQRFRKALLPTYDVFDEDRYFEPFHGPQILTIAGRRLGISICEDVWNDRDFWKRRRYHFDPIQELVGAGVDAIVNLSASPFAVGKHSAARRDARQHGARNTSGRSLYVNQIGGNDDLVFDGRSSAFNSAGAATARGRSFATDVVIVDLDTEHAARPGRRTRRRVGHLGRARARHERLRQEVRLLVRRARPLGRHRLGADRRDCRRSRRPGPRARRADAVAVLEPGQHRRLARAGRAASASPR